MSESSSATPEKVPQVASPRPKMELPKQDGKVLIFRRFRRLPDGTVLDAYHYGKKAWAMWVDAADLGSSH